MCEGTRNRMQTHQHEVHELGDWLRVRRGCPFSLPLPLAQKLCGFTQPGLSQQALPSTESAAQPFQHSSALQVPCFQTRAWRPWVDTAAERKAYEDTQTLPGNTAQPPFCTASIQIRDFNFQGAGTRASPLHTIVITWLLFNRKGVKEETRQQRLATYPALPKSCI